MAVVAIVVAVLTGAVCGFFVYVLVQFRREEKHLKRHDDVPTGFAMVASDQVVIPLETPREERCKDSANQKAHKQKRRGSSC
jgi:heme/copper-type cytochrome/quinol oxidase subunit 2